MFIRFDPTHERDRQTETHTHSDTETPHDDIGRAYASHRAEKSTTMCILDELHTSSLALIARVPCRDSALQRDPDRQQTAR